METHLTHNILLYVSRTHYGFTYELAILIKGEVSLVHANYGVMLSLSLSLLPLLYASISIAPILHGHPIVTQVFIRL